jgi:hydrogenase 3 maturation protease
MSIWQNLLESLLESKRRDLARAPRLAVVGIGNELCADDAAGVLVVREVDRRINRIAASRRRAAHPAKGGLNPTCLYAIDGGSAPENVTGSLRRYEPDIVLLIDAADMGETPGSVRWVSLEEIDGISASTHSLPLSLFAAYLASELDCEAAILGIQPSSVEMGQPVSAPVLAAVEAVSTGLRDLLLLK